MSCIIAWCLVYRMNFVTFESIHWRQLEIHRSCIATKSIWKKVLKRRKNVVHLNKSMIHEHRFLRYTNFNKFCSEIEEKSIHSKVASVCYRCDECYALAKDPWVFLKYHRWISNWVIKIVKRMLRGRAKMYLLH